MSSSLFVCLSVCLSVSLSVCLQLCAKTSKRICMEFLGKVGSGQRTNGYSLVAIRITDPNPDSYRDTDLWKWGTLNSWSPVHSVFICAVYERSQIRGHVSQANLCLQCLVGLHSADNRQRIDGFVRRGEQAACTISQLISNAWYTLAVDTARQHGRLDTRFYGPWTRVVCIDVHWWKAVQQYTLQWKSCRAR